MKLDNVPFWTIPADISQNCPTLALRVYAYTTKASVLDNFDLKPLKIVQKS